MFKKTIALVSTLALAISMASLSSLAYADEDITLSVIPDKNVDVILSLGDTAVDVSNFGNDIKNALINKGLNADRINIQAVETNTANLQNSFTWVNDVNSSVGSIQFLSNGTQISMRGNTRNAGFNKFYNINNSAADIKANELSFNFSLDYGDNFNGAGVLINTSIDDPNKAVSQQKMSGYALMFKEDGKAYLFKIVNWGSGEQIDTAGNNQGRAPTLNTNGRVSLVGTITTGNSGSFSLLMEKNKISLYKSNVLQGTLALPQHFGWGFGFFSDHYSHACDRIGQFSLSNISLKTTIAKDFSLVIREPSWRDDAAHFMVNVEDNVRPEFDDPQKSGEILTRLINNEVDYIALGTPTNETQANNFIQRNNDKGIFVNNSNYQNIIDETSNYIINKLIPDSTGEQYALVGEPVDIKVIPENFKSNTATTEYPNGRWRLTHEYDFYENNEGQANWSGQRRDDLPSVFDKPGKYDIEFGEAHPNPRYIYVHRRPVAMFSAIVGKNGDNFNIDLQDYSYDLDLESQEDRGISEYEWKWKKTTDTSWTDGEIPSSLPLGEDYIVQLRVKDYQNTWSAPEAQYITTANVAVQPVANFTFGKSTISKFEPLVVNDVSYDPGGAALTQKEWIVTKNGTQVYKSSTPLTNFNAAGLGEGNYKVSLRVYNSYNLWSETFSRSLTVTTDTEAPSAILSPTYADWTNQSVTVNAEFTDAGGSGFNYYRYAITNSATAPSANDSSWSAHNQSTTMNLPVSTEGETYLHLEAYDVAGNKWSRTAGPYQIDKTKPTISVLPSTTGWTNQDIVVNITANDDRSGISTITLPDGSKINASAPRNYTVTENGTYNFSVEDKAGNTASTSINITNIDKVDPELKLTQTPTEWTSGDVTITAEATDDGGSNVQTITKPDNTTVNSDTSTFVVSKNGTYTFKLKDSAGNLITKDIEITNIDKTAPVLTNTLSTSDWTRNGVTIHVTATDTQSGSLQIKMPDGTWKTGDSFDYTVPSNGTYTFVAKDLVGNETPLDVEISKIDTTKPDLTLTSDEDDWTSGNLNITVDSTDAGAGIDYIQLPNGDKIYDTTNTFEVTKNDSYTVTVVDKVGNSTTKTINITKIDKTNPVINVSPPPSQWIGSDYTFSVVAADSDSGVKSITLPDGTVVNDFTSNYTVSDNGSYTFTVTDNVGNTSSKTVVVEKIDKDDPTIDLSLDTTDWTNQDVIITYVIDDGDGSGVKIVTLPDGSIVEETSGTFAAGSNGNYTFTAEDEVENKTSETIKIENIDKTAPYIDFSINNNTWVPDEKTIRVTASDALSGVSRIQLPDGTWVSESSSEYTVTDNGDYTFKAEDVAGNVSTRTVNVQGIDRVNPSMTLTPSTTAWTGSNVTISVAATDNESGVSSILLPDGTTINDSGATNYTVTNNGTYEFTVTDKVGNTYTDSIIVDNIDNVKPTLDLSLNTEDWDPENVVITVASSDDQSGVKRIQTPDGEWVDSDNIEYTVTENKEYVFTVEDNVGNTTTKTITVSNLDLVKPEITLDADLVTWSGSTVTITATTSDSQSGVAKVKLPNGTWVINTSKSNPFIASFDASENGTYEFTVEDSVGNSQKASVTVSNIDKTSPIGVITGTPNPSIWTNGNVALDLVASDSDSGVSKIKLPDETWVDSDHAIYTANTNGKYSFVIEDNVGNQTPISFTVGNIDKVKPTLTLTSDTTSWTNKSFNINAVGSDDLSGVLRIKLPNENWVDSDSTSFEVTKNGTYEFTVEDKAHNLYTTSVEITNIDKKLPSYTVVSDPDSWTSGNVDLVVSAFDEDSQIAKIVLPDDEVITDDHHTFTATDNGDYSFEFYDVAGNKSETTFTVDNIDRVKPTLDIEYSDDWTAGNVTVKVETTDAQSGVKEITLPDGTKVSDTEATFIASDNQKYTFTVEDNVGNTFSKEITVSSIDRDNPILTVTPETMDWVSDSVKIAADATDASSGVANITNPDGNVVDGNSSNFTAVNNGEYSFTATDEVGNSTTKKVNINNIDKTNPWLQLTYDNSWSATTVTINVETADSQSGVKSITLPDDSTVNDDNASFVAGVNGVYDFTVTDNVGNTTTKSVNVENIDHVKPTLDLDYDSSWTATNVPVTVDVSDSQSGVEKIVYPDGTETSDSLSTFIINENGSYEFKVIDNVGNQTVKEITISNVDHTNPELTLTYDNSWSATTVTVNADASDSQSGVKSITLPDGTSTTDSNVDFVADDNGVYSFTVEDNVGNKTTKTVDISNLDHVNPWLELTYDNSWSPDQVTISVSSSDSQSGVDFITLPDGSTVDDNTANFIVDENNTYEFTVTDKVGNSITKSIKVTNLDHTAPSLVLTYDDVWSGTDVIINADTSDSQSQVSKLQLPDGTWTTDLNVDYTVSENGTYTFTSVDNVNNKTTKSVVITNIDHTKPSLDLTYDDSWSATDVTVNVATADSQSGIDYITLPDGSEVSASSSTFVINENGTYQFKVIDKVGNETVKSIEITNLDHTNPELVLTYDDSWNGSSILVSVDSTDSQSGVKRIKTPEGWTLGDHAEYTVSENGIFEFISEDNVGNRTIKTVNVSNLDHNAPVIVIDYNSNWTNKDLPITITAQDESSGVKSITLPDGSIVDGSTAVFTATENGSYTFIVTDNVGNKSSETVKIKNIDKTNPELSLSYNDSWSATTVTINATASDSQSGVKGIQLPDGSIVNSTNASFTVSTNGVYSFTVTDNVGNSTTKSVNIENVDSTDPGLELTYDNSWSPDTVDITAEATDSQSGVKSIKLPNGKIVKTSQTVFTVSDNGTYTFVAEDNVGNTTIKTVKITNIDKNKPELKVDYNKDWTNKNVAVTVKGSDSQSGLIYILLPDGKKVINNVATFTVSKNGKYVFSTSDSVNNTTSVEINVTNIDKDLPKVELLQLDSDPTSKAVRIQYSANDAMSGVKFVTVPNGSQVKETSGTFTVDTNGTYTFSVTDLAGNRYSTNINVSNIDQVSPSLTITPSTTEWVNDSITLKAEGIDGENKIVRIKTEGQDWVNGNSLEITVTNNGIYTFTVEDAAGNTSEKSYTVTNIDAKKPTSPNLNNDFSTTGTQIGSVLHLDSGVDLESGVYTVQYRLEGATVQSWSDYLDPIQITNVGTTKVIVRTVDNASNESEYKEYTVTVKPWIAISVKQLPESNSSKISITSNGVENFETYAAQDTDSESSIFYNGIQYLVGKTKELFDHFESDENGIHSLNSDISFENDSEKIIYNIDLK